MQTPRYNLGAAIAAVALLTLTACGGGSGGDTDSKAPATDTPSTTAVPEWDTTWDKTGTTKIDQSVIARYGKADAQALAEGSEALLEEYTFNNDLLAGDSADNKTRLLEVGDQMTPDARRDWTRAVETHSKDRTDLEAARLVYALAPSDVYPTFDKFDDKNADAPADGPAAINPVISAPRLSLEADGRVSVKSSVNADIRVSHAGQPKLWHFKRQNTFWMLKTANGWKIDGWNGKFIASGSLTAEK